MVSNADKAFLAITLAVSITEKEKRKRRWCKEWYKMRYRFTHEHLQRTLQATEPDDYKNFLRMDNDYFETLLELIRPNIEKQDTNMRQAIPASQRLSITLRYLVTGMDLEDLKFMCAVAPRTLDLIIQETCEAIIQKLKRIYPGPAVMCFCFSLIVPRTIEDWKKVAKDFERRWNFPNCIGAVDGKHIEIEKPSNSGSYYFNYKKTFSIVLMAIVNANYQFMMVDVGANGRMSDGGTLKNTKFWQLFSESENKLNIPEPCELLESDKKFPFVLVGDEAFQLTPNFMKPYNKAVLTDERRIFNYRLSRARRVVENAFGILSWRFKIFIKDIGLHPDKTRKVVLAACHLHNYLCEKNKNKYIQPGDIDIEEPNTTVTKGAWRQGRQLLTWLTWLWDTNIYFGISV
ncbi:unnamed protein product [Pieris macdunnoughi]|uniref:DDE Tnp4 domain-containing protein n=1 Tax=Pieris macdunnoughi TaxID=345717 RepID=A0A821SYR7_9NEOP|nr:unnamed protein product [Pieris macdunnoughi]